jgi:hypothetical protein
LNIDLFFQRIETHSCNAIIYSIFNQYLDSLYFYRLIIESDNFEKVRNTLFDIEIGYELANNRPHIVIIFKVDFDLNNVNAIKKGQQMSSTILWTKVTISEMKPLVVRI